MKKIDKALFTAVESGDLEKVVDLLERGADVNAKNEEGDTVLMFEKNIEMVKLLLDAGADVNAKNLEGNTPFIIAAEYISNNKVFELLIKNGADVNDKNIYGYSAIKWAVNYGDFEKFKLLVEAGADFEDEDLLFWGASYEGNPKIINIILKSGVDVNYKDKSGRTALIYGALHMCNPKVFELLLKRGADPDIKDDDKRTALDYAMDRDNLELVKLLLKYDADTRDALFYAVTTEKKDLVKLLLESGEDVNIKNKYGGNLLDEAIRMNSFRNSDLDIIKMLIEAGVDINANFGKRRNHNSFMEDRSSLEIAIDENNLKVVKLLLEHGAKVDPYNYKVMSFITDNNLDSLVV